MARIRTAEAAMDAEIDRLVEARSGLGVDATDPRLDALGRIISGIDDETGVRDEARALMLAGAETTSNALGFLLLLLARHPDVRNRLEEEIDDRTRDDAPFLEAVILGQFVVERFLSEARMAAAAGGIGAGGVNHVAHLAGALVGVALIWTLQKLLPPE